MNIDTRQVTQKTYCRAETDRTFFNASQLTGGVNRMFPFRNVTPLDRQTVVRMNKDTLNALALVDTSKGATITVISRRACLSPIRSIATC